MAGNLSLSSTDDPSVVRSVVAAGMHKGEDGGLHLNDVLGGRVEEDSAGIEYTSDGGTTSASYEDPAVIERQQLEERLADARQDLAEPAAPAGVAADVTLQPAEIYNQRLDQIKQANPEALEALNSYDGPEPPVAVLEILSQSPVGPDVAIALAQNPDVCQKLAEMPVDEAVRDTREYLAMLQGRYAGMQEAAVYHAQQTAQRQPRRASNLRPTRPVAGTVRSDPDPGSMSFQEYKTWYSKHHGRRGR